MNKRHAFRPDSLGPLESRIALSGLGAALHRSAPLVRVAAVRSRAATAPDRDTATFEINFLTGMVPHHQMAIDMSKLVRRYGSDPQVKALAGRIIAAQQPEIRMMGRFLAKDGVRDYRPGKARNEVMELRHLGSLRGAEIDRMFLTMMIEHHSMAVEGNTMGMAGAREAQTRASQVGVRTLATNIVATQTREIAEMRSLLARGA